MHSFLAHDLVDDGAVLAEEASGATAVVAAVAEPKDPQHLRGLRGRRVVDGDGVDLLVAEPRAIEGDDDGQLVACQVERERWHALEAAVLGHELLTDLSEGDEGQSTVLRGLVVL